MNAMKKARNLILLAAWCVAPAIGFAAPCAGTNINTTLLWEEYEITKGTKMAVWRGASVTISDDASAPYHMVVGECIGTLIYNPDGTGQGSGFCARADKDGDVLNEEWVRFYGTESKGTWKNVGGTGKFAKAANTAKWEDIWEQGKAGATRWVGDCQ
jgi:hypothetical protein